MEKLSVHVDSFLVVACVDPVARSVDEAVAGFLVSLQTLASIQKTDTFVVLPSLVERMSRDNSMCSDMKYGLVVPIQTICVAETLVQEAVVVVDVKTEVVCAE